MSEERFTDGNIADVVKIGDTVRRSTDFWTPAIHALLEYLQQRGFHAAPRVLGIDEKGREILTYLPGVTAPADMAGFLDDGFLRSAAALLRRYHDAVTGFVPPPGARWNRMPGAPDGAIICHNDIAPWNLITVDGAATGLIDWDLAAPGPPEWDLAYALWRCVPLYEDAVYGGPLEQARRIRLFCEVYGWTDYPRLIDTILQRQQVVLDTLHAWAAAGVPAFVRMVAEGYHVEGVRRNMQYLQRVRLEILEFLQ